MAHLRYTLPRSNSQLSLGAAVLPLTRGATGKAAHVLPASAAPASATNSSRAFQLLLNPTPPPWKKLLRSQRFFSSSTSFFSSRDKKGKGEEEKKSGEKSDRIPDPSPDRSLIFSSESNHRQRQGMKE